MTYSPWRTGSADHTSTNKKGNGDGGTGGRERVRTDRSRVFPGGARDTGHRGGGGQRSGRREDPRPSAQARLGARDARRGSDRQGRGHLRERTRDSRLL